MSWAGEGCVFSFVEARSFHFVGGLRSERCLQLLDPWESDWAFATNYCSCGCSTQEELDERIVRQTGCWRFFHDFSVGHDISTLSDLQNFLDALFDD
jgi:hypothetical protein